MGKILIFSERFLKTWKPGEKLFVQNFRTKYIYEIFEFNFFLLNYFNNLIAFIIIITFM